MTIDNHIIHQYREVFIQFSYFSLYAVACPIASVTVLIYNLIEIYGNKNLMVKAFRRPPQEFARNIGPWLGIWQTLTILAVISNCMILLVASDLRKAFDSYSDYMWLIFAYETSILALKYVLGLLINDTPYWV